MKKKVDKIVAVLKNEYGTKMICYLHYREPWQLLFSVIMSAQCTDARVNQVTENLYQKYATLEEFARADIKELEKDIFSLGFYHSKAKNLIACAKRLVEVYDGVIPSDIEELITLAGVGRKTANVIRGNLYNIPSIVVDTHVKRISRRLGLTKEEDPTKIEFDLMNILPKDYWILYNVQVITFGREICTARSPKCQRCFLKEYCEYVKEK